MKTNTKNILLYGFITIAALVVLFSLYSTADAACGQSCPAEKSWWKTSDYFDTWTWDGYSGVGPTCGATQEPTWGNWTAWGWFGSDYWGYYTCSCQTVVCAPQPCVAPALNPPNPPCETKKIVVDDPDGAYTSIVNTISWSPVAGATQYQLEWCPEGTAFGEYGCRSTYTSDTSLTQSVLPVGSNPAQWAGGVVAGTTYNVRAKVNTASGCTLPGAWADTTCFVENIDITPPVSRITSPEKLTSFSQASSGFDVYVEDSDGGSGLQEGGCSYSVLDEASGWTKLNAFRACNTPNTPIRITIEPGTGDCRSALARDYYSCFVNVYSKDNAGNTFGTSREFKIAKESSTTTITLPAAGSSVSSDFSVFASDKFSRFAPSGNCYYYIYDTAVGQTRGWTNRTCNSSFNITVGPTADCRTIGGGCSVFALAVDSTGWPGVTDVKTYNITAKVEPTCSALSYPTDKWQRVWYDYATGGCLGDGPDETAEKFDNNWGSGVLAWDKSDQMKFVSSRSVNFPAGEYAFTLGSDDGAILYIDNSVVINSFSDHPYQTQTANLDLTSGYHNIMLEYYENAGDARVSFDYAAVVALPCSVPTGLNCETTATSIGAGWNTVAGITGYRVEWQLDLTSTWYSWYSAVAQGTNYDITGLTPNTAYKVRVRGETGSNTQCTAPTDYSSSINCATTNCGKVNTPFQDSYAVSGSSCNVSITHMGEDLTDNTRKNEVSYSRLTPVGSPATIEMDDELANNGDCDLDLKFTNTWSSALGKLSVTSKFENYNSGGLFSTGHDYDYGYKVSSNNCVIKEIRQISGSIGAFTTGTDPPSLSDDKRSAVALQPYEPNIYIPQIVNQSQYEYTLEECTANAHCTANPNTAKCNVGVTSNFPQNTCVDSVAPTITIGEIKRTTPDPKVITNNWLKAGIYEITVSVADNAGGSGVDTSYRPVTIRSKGADDAWNTADDRTYPLVRTSANKFNVLVGSASSSANDCVDEGELGSLGRCRIEVLARDFAGNETVLLPYPTFKIDYTAPSAQ